MVPEPDFEIHMDGTDCRPWPPQKRTDILSGVLSDSLCGIRNFFHLTYILSFWHLIWHFFELYLAFLSDIYFEILYIWHSISDFTCIPDILFGYLAWGSGALESWPAWPAEPAGHRVLVPHLAAEKNWDDLGPHHFVRKIWKHNKPIPPSIKHHWLYDYPLVN